MVFYKFSPWHPIITPIIELIICGQCGIWFFIFLTWPSNLNLILYLIHLHFPGACHGWLTWKASSSRNHIHTTTITFTLPSLLFLRTPPSSYPKPTPFPLSSLMTGSSDSFLPQLSTRGNHWVNSDLCSPFTVPYLTRRCSALKTVSHPLFMTCFTPNSPGWFSAPWLSLLGLLCWLLLLYPVLNAGVFQHLFLISLSTSLSLWVTSSILMTNFYMFTVSKAVSAQNSLLNNKPTCLLHVNVSQAFHIQFMPSWTSGLGHL